MTGTKTLALKIILREFITLFENDCFAQVIIEIPYIFVQTVVYGVIVYAMIGFEWTAGKFFWYIFCMFFTLLYFTLYGMMSVAVTPNHSIAAITASAIFAIWNIFSGFVVPRTVSSSISSLNRSGKQ